MAFVRQSYPEVICPRSSGPGRSPLHEIRTNFADRLYEVLPKDEDGCFVRPDDNTLYDQVARAGEGEIYMQLHHETAQALGSPGSSYVGMISAWYFLCSTCGFILSGAYTTKEWER